MHKALLSLALISTASAGCGPMLFPAVRRLDPDSQKEVDQIWVNLLTPPRRVDRETLLDALVLYPLHHNGIDRLSLTAEKDLPDRRRAVLDIRFDRTHPGVDCFTVQLFDGTGQLCRFENYTGEEVLRHIDEFGGANGSIPSGEPESRLIESRLERVRAATQPSVDGL